MPVKENLYMKSNIPSIITSITYWQGLKLKVSVKQLLITKADWN